MRTRAQAADAGSTGGRPRRHERRDPVRQAVSKRLDPDPAAAVVAPPRSPQGREAVYRVNVIAHTAAALPVGHPADPAAELVTVAIQAPRTILAEFNTHRTIGKNVESSRAVKIESRLAMLRENPYVPGATPDGRPLLGNNPGMVAVAPLTELQIANGEHYYRKAAGDAATWAEMLLGCGWHKQDVNRLTEPFSWTRILATGNRGAWNHFLWLRTAEDVYPPLRVIARAIAVALARSVPRRVIPGKLDSWHLPYITDTDRAASLAWARRVCGGIDEFQPSEARLGPWRSVREAELLNYHVPTMFLCRWSAARCAMISYAKFGDGRSYDALDKMFDEKLIPPDTNRPPHASCAEHQAQIIFAGSLPAAGVGGNLGHWCKQYRKCLPGEYHPTFAPDAATLAGWNIPDELFEPLT